MSNTRSGTVWDFDSDLPATGRENTVEHNGLELLAQIAVHLGGMAARNKREQERRDRLAQSWAANPDIGNNGVFPSTAGQNLVLDLGGPPMGKIWQVRHLFVGGPVLGVAATGSAYAIVQGAPPAPQNTPAANVFDQANALPLTAFYGTHQFWIDGGDHLWVVFVNGTAGSTYVAQGTVEEWWEEDFAVAEFGSG